MNYYYSDDNKKPVGPYTFAQLRDLSYQGLITTETFVIEEGGTEWKRYAEVLNPPPKPVVVEVPSPAVVESVKSGPSSGVKPRPLVPATAPAAVPSATPHPTPVVGIFTAIFCFICCFPIGFMEWGQTAKGWVWLLLSCFTGFGLLIAIVDYWMCYVAQKKRPLKEWEFFPH